MKRNHREETGAVPAEATSVCAVMRALPAGASAKGGRAAGAARWAELQAWVSCFLARKKKGEKKGRGKKREGEQLPSNDSRSVFSPFPSLR